VEKEEEDVGRGSVEEGLDEVSKNVVSLVLWFCFPFLLNLN